MCITVAYTYCVLLRCTRIDVLPPPLRYRGACSARWLYTSIQYDNFIHIYNIYIGYYVKSNYAAGQSAERFASLDPNKKRLIENVTERAAPIADRLVVPTYVL